MKILTYLLIVFSIFAFALAGYNTYLSLTHPLKYKQEIIFYSEKNELDPALISSIINVESSFKTEAKSNKNAIGLMQIKLTTANYMCSLNNHNYVTEKDLFNEEINIMLGCEYFKYLLNKFTSTETALAAYNAGETTVRNWLKNKKYSLNGKTLENIPYTETKNYVKKVYKNFNYYKKLFTS